MSEIKAVLFDMGGVIVRLDSLFNVLGPSELTHEQISERWIISDSVQAFERGKCTVDEFASSIVTEMSLAGTADEFVSRFGAFPQGMFPGAAELVASVPATVTTGVLSNTSALHWEHQIDNEAIRELCERSYLSYELGLAKPGREIYDYAVADLDLAAEHVLFIDDNQINVDGARAAGLCAGLAKGPVEAAAVLGRFGVVNP